ncbi:MAG: hypothetical protein AAF573_22610 [Bacteroidota bacterium]
MDLNEAWKKLNEEKFSSSIKKEDIMEAIMKESSLTIFKLKKGLKYKLYWVYFFIALFTVGIFLSLDKLPLLILSSIFLILYIMGALTLYGQLENMDDQIDASKDTLSEMRKHRDLMKQALKNETRWGWVTFPIVIAAVFFLPPLVEGLPLTEIITDSKFLVKLAIGYGLIMPIAMWVANKMNDHAYGGHLNELEENIKRLEAM